MKTALQLDKIITTRQTGGLLGGYKPLLLGQRLKALAFIFGYGKFAFAYFPQPHSSHIAFDSSLPHKGAYRTKRVDENRSTAR